MMQLTVSDGCTIAARFEGPEDAPVLVMSNSLGTTHAMWKAQMAALTRKFRVLRYDTRGHGASDAPPGAYSLDRLGRDVVDMLDLLAIEQAHFCGLSLGGMTGQWLAVQEPARLKHLVLANTAAYMGPPSGWQARIESVWHSGMAPLADAAIARWFTTGFADAAPHMVAAIRAMLLQTSVLGYAGCCAAIRDMDLRPLAALNRVPTLVIAGAADPATSVADAQFLQQQAANARLAVLDAAHLSNVEQPEGFTAALIDFLTVV